MRSPSPGTPDAELEKLIQGALEMADSIRDLGAEHAVAAKTAAGPAPEVVADMLAPDALIRDGTVEISVAENEMAVEASFQPPSGGGNSVTLGDVQALLNKRGVKYGIDWSTITDAIDRCDATHAPQTAVTIARGDPPREEIPEHIEIDPGLLAAPEHSAGDQAVDYRALSPFHIVAAGQVLGRVVPVEPGVLGTNVEGATVPFRKRKLETVSLGKGVRLDGRNVVAHRDGRFLCASGAASVTEVLKIAGDVDYATGHVDFPGDVIVEGQVKPGFKVKASGTVVVGRVLSATDVSVGGDLEAHHGILGRGNGIVRVRGTIQTGFIENCYVEAYKAIYVRRGCLNAAVRTLDRLDLGDRGVVVGGTVVAQNGVQAGHIGTESGTRTEIRCGEDFLVSRRLDWIRDKSIALAAKLKEIERAANARGGGGPQVEAASDRIRAAIRTLAQTARSLAAGLDRNEAAEVTVAGTLHPGTYVEICRVPFVVERPMRAVRLTLSKQQARIVARPIR